ncbi:MAG: F0F1 ATP synthase subunit delta [Desulfovermiculus sp.]|nr:F0F1 ATP synthase subunit delta [Desulfovermiculus sp.]
MREQVIAKRYARALFAIGQEQGGEELKTYGQHLEQLAQVMREAPQLVRLFRNPIVRVEHKKGVVNAILDRLEITGTVRQFCFYLADRERLANFLEIQEYFSRLLDANEGILRGELVTAIDLTKTKQDQITKKLEKQLQGQLVLDYETDASILGGLVLRVGDKVYDASLRAQLDQMRETIKRGE